MSIVVTVLIKDTKLWHETIIIRGRKVSVRDENYNYGGGTYHVSYDGYNQSPCTPFFIPPTKSHGPTFPLLHVPQQVSLLSDGGVEPFFALYSKIS